MWCVTINPIVKTLNLKIFLLCYAIRKMKCSCIMRCHNRCSLQCYSTTLNTWFQFVFLCNTNWNVMKEQKIIINNKLKIIASIVDHPKRFHHSRACENPDPKGKTHNAYITVGDKWKEKNEKIRVSRKGCSAVSAHTYILIHNVLALLLGSTRKYVLQIMTPDSESRPRAAGTGSCLKKFYSNET